jgi:CRISPR-associated protein Csx3
MQPMQETMQQPAVLIGGPPHAGKSVLTYSLTRALRQYGIEHYVMRACPDGEGHWSQEAPRQVAEAIRKKGVYTDEFVHSVCADIESRKVPFIVDIGGLPRGEQFQIFRSCTHAILLSHPTPASVNWHELVRAYTLELLADLISTLDGPSALETSYPIVRGTLTGLQRGSVVTGEPFESLTRALIKLFLRTSLGLEQTHMGHRASTETVLNLPQLLRALVPNALDWTPDLLPRLLEVIPCDEPLAVYGRAAHWVYTSLALHTCPVPFFQFDARLGWLEPLSIQSGPGLHPDLTFEPEVREEYTLLHCHPQTSHLNYRELQHLQAPVLSTTRGLILNGRLPLWLASSLAMCYKLANLPWIAGYYPQTKEAIVIFSQIPQYRPGDRVPVTFKD